MRGEPQRIAAGRVDLRHPLEFEADPVVIRGAIRLSAPDLEANRLPIPRDREVILYCS